MNSNNRLLAAPESDIPNWSDAPRNVGPETRAFAHDLAQADQVFSAPLPPSIRESDMIPHYTAPPALRRRQPNVIPRRAFVTVAAIAGLALAAVVGPDIVRSTPTRGPSAAAQIGGNSYAQKQGQTWTDVVSGKPSFQEREEWAADSSK